MTGSASCLLHGIGGASWAPVLPALAPARVLDWALPGFAGTPMLAETSFAAWAEALRQRLDAEGIPRIDLIGHSIGGMLALDFALRFPERVRGLVLYATTPAFGGRDPPSPRPSWPSAWRRSRPGRTCRRWPRPASGRCSAPARPAPWRTWRWPPWPRRRRPPTAPPSAA